MMRARNSGSASRMSHGGGALSDDQLAQLKAYFGYDKPPLVAYGQWLSRLAHGDLGDSFRYGEPVTQVIAGAMPVTLTYGVLSLFFTYLISVPLGILKGMKHGTLVDTGSSIVIFIA